jgi:hypothetical protein
VGVGCFIGLTGGSSTANTICGFGKSFVEYSGNAGFGPGGGYSYYNGFENDGTPIVGQSASVGGGVGADATVDVTYTGITPLNGRKTCN